MKNYIYMIGNNLGAVKVGVSNNPSRRVKQLQTANQDKLSLLFQEEFECSRHHVLQVEKLVHKDLARICNKKSGEWFSIIPEQIEQVKNTIIWHRIRYDDCVIN